MKCAEVERILPEVIDGGQQDAEFQAHLKSCPVCSELVSELNLIISEARNLAESYEPPDRVWVNISNQLRAEGIIREQVPVPARPVVRPVPAPARRWNAWWLAPVAAAILAAGSYQLTRHPATNQVAVQVPPPATQTQASTPAASATNAPEVAKTETQPPTVSRQIPASPQIENRPVEAARNRVHMPAPASRPAAGSPNAEEPGLRAEVAGPDNPEDQRFITEVSQGAPPTLRATYEKQLRAVNAEIRETQEYIRRHPGDPDARQHLMDVYQQKAMLYQIALDRIQ